MDERRFGSSLNHLCFLFLFETCGHCLVARFNHIQSPRPQEEEKNRENGVVSGTSFFLSLTFDFSLEMGVSKYTQTWCLTSTESIRLIKNGEKRGRGVWKGGGERLYTYHYTVTTRMTSALRWAVMKAILVFHHCEGQSHKTVSTDNRTDP